MSASSQELRPRGRRSATPQTQIMESDQQAVAPKPKSNAPKSLAESTRPRDAARRARLVGASQVSQGGSKAAPMDSRRAGFPAIPAAPQTAPSAGARPVSAQTAPKATPSAAARGLKQSLNSVAANSVAAGELNSAATQRLTRPQSLTRAELRRGGRRSAAALKQDAAWRSAKSAQRGGIVLAAAGLALAVVAPNAAGSLAVNAPLANGLPSSSAPISAAADVSLDFSETKTSSKADPDGKLRQVLSASADKVTPTASKGTLSSPLDKLSMTSPYGYRVNPLTGASGELHTGQDYAASCGSNVYAAAGGTVSFASWHQYGGGNRVVIDHGNGLSTTYNHNTSLKVQVGQKVSRGDLIALSGTTGNSTGCHVHFEVMVNDKTIDPLGWL